MHWKIAKILPTILLFWSGSAIAGESQDAEDRVNFLTQSHNALPDVQDALAILTVKVCSERSNIFLQRMSIEHTITKQRYIVRPNPVQEPEDWNVEKNNGESPMMAHVKRDGFVQHTVFIDLPAGRYQITELGMTRKRSGFSHDSAAGTTRKRSIYSLASIDDIAGLFFWYDDYDPLAYIGELHIEFKDGFSSAPILFVTRSPSSHVEEIRTRYAGVADQRVGEGNLWLQGPTGGMARKGNVVCQYP